jgi:preprotein translocase subunit YajC
MSITDLPILLQETLSQAAPATGPGDAGTGAPATAPQASNPLVSWVVPAAMMFLVFYVFIIGPDRKQRKKREQMLASLQKGAKVMTTGGLYGIVNQVQDQIVTLQVADGVRLRFAMSAIQQVIEETAEPAKG